MITNTLPTKTFWIVSFILLFATSCKENKLEVDVSNITIPAVKIDRLEKDLFSIDQKHIQEQTKAMQKKYGPFYSHFIEGFINKGGINDTSYIENIKRFVSDKDMRQVYNECSNAFSSLIPLEEELTQAFKHVHYYFPNKTIPRVTSLISGFNYSIISIDNTIGIGLEMYLGQTNPFYSMLPTDLFPAYRKRNMRKEFIVSDCLKGWINSNFEIKTSRNDLLSNMIRSGKELYLLDAFLPQISDTIKIGYTQNQLEWCKKNEFNMWSFFIAKKMLYNTDEAENTKYFADGPFTSGFNKESPSRVAQWIGWQIVRSYMYKNKNITPQQLIEEADAQKILKESKYKPKE